MKQIIGIVACNEEQLTLFLKFLNLKKKQVIWINGSNALTGFIFDKVYFVGDYNKTPRYYDLIQEIRHRMSPTCIVKYIREAI